VRRTRSFKRLALDQFHRIEALPCFLANAELEYGSDILVSQRRDARLRFAQKTFWASVLRAAVTVLIIFNATFRWSNVSVARYVTPIAPRPSSQRLPSA
jgi:hypothetical protein